MSITGAPPPPVAEIAAEALPAKEQQAADVPAPQPKPPIPLPSHRQVCKCLRRAGACLTAWAAPASAIFAGIALLFTLDQIREAKNTNRATAMNKLAVDIPEEIRSMTEDKTEPQRIISHLHLLYLNRKLDAIDDDFYQFYGRQWCEAISGNPVICDSWKKSAEAHNDKQFKSFAASILSGRLCNKSIRSDTCRGL